MDVSKRRDSPISFDQLIICLIIHETHSFFWPNSRLYSAAIVPEFMWNHMICFLSANAAPFTRFHSLKIVPKIVLMILMGNFQFSCSNFS